MAREYGGVGPTTLHAVHVEHSLSRKPSASSASASSHSRRSSSSLTGSPVLPQQHKHRRTPSSASLDSGASSSVKSRKISSSSPSTACSAMASTTTTPGTPAPAASTTAAAAAAASKKTKTSKGKKKKKKTRDSAAAASPSKSRLPTRVTSSDDSSTTTVTSALHERKATPPTTLPEQQNEEEHEKLGALELAPTDMATRRASSSAASSVVNGETSIANETMPLGDAATNDDDDDHVEGWAEPTMGSTTNGAHDATGSSSAPSYAEVTQHNPPADSNNAVVEPAPLANGTDVQTDDEATAATAIAEEHVAELTIPTDDSPRAPSSSTDEPGRAVEATDQVADVAQAEARSTAEPLAPEAEAEAEAEIEIEAGDGLEDSSMIEHASEGDDDHQRQLDRVASSDQQQQPLCATVESAAHATLSDDDDDAAAAGMSSGSAANEDEEKPLDESPQPQRLTDVHEPDAEMAPTELSPPATTAPTTMDAMASDDDDAGDEGAIKLGEAASQQLKVDQHVEEAMVAAGAEVLADDAAEIQQQQQQQEEITDAGDDDADAPLDQGEIAQRLDDAMDAAVAASSAPPPPPPPPAQQIDAPPVQEQAPREESEHEREEDGPVVESKPFVTSIMPADDDFATRESGAADETPPQESSSQESSPQESGTRDESTQESGTSDREAAKDVADETPTRDNDDDEEEEGRPPPPPQADPPSLTLALVSAWRNTTWLQRAPALLAAVAINFGLPFINGVMLGLGELFAREFIGVRWGWATPFADTLNRGGVGLRAAGTRAPAGQGPSAATRTAVETLEEAVAEH